jgi:hypothetical protein
MMAVLEDPVAESQGQLVLVAIGRILDGIEPAGGH